MISVLVGLVFIAVGVWGLALGWDIFLKALKALLPVSFILGGLVAVVFGLSGMKRKKDDRE